MNEEQKNKAKEAHGKVTNWLIGLGVPANWAKVGAGIIIGGAIGCMSTCQQSCESVPPPTAAQVQAAHELYHIATGTECQYRVVPVEAIKK